MVLENSFNRRWVSLLAVFVITLISSCSQNSKPTDSLNAASKLKWYQGGSLHQAKVHEWNTSEERNKLATCGDFIAANLKQKGIQPNSLDDVKRMATELLACIEEAIKAPNTDNMAVAEIAAACTILLDS